MLIALIVFMIACLITATAVLYAVETIADRKASAKFDAIWIDPRTVQARRERFAVFG